MPFDNSTLALSDYNIFLCAIHKTTRANFEKKKEIRESVMKERKGERKKRRKE